LSYGLPRDARVEIAVFDLLGRRVRRLESGSRLAGRHRVVWDGRNESGAQLGNGVYMVRMTAAGNTWTRKLVLAR
jgi:flagellar hook assembly protein FlgD